MFNVLGTGPWPTRYRDRYRAGGFKSAPPFVPTDIANLALWLDASDLTTISETGGSVSQWSDKSGNGYNATQGTGANQPITGTRTINGKNILAFLGGGDRMLLPGPFSISNGGNTLFIVAVCDLTTGNQRLFRGTSGGDGNERWGAILYTSNTGISILRSGTGNAQVTLTTKTDPHIYTVRAGTNVIPYLDGVIGTSGGVRGDTILDQITIGGYSAANGAESWVGGIAEIIAYGSNLNDADTNAVGNYLANKWGVTWTPI